MGQGYTVESDELREHARNLQALQDRFQAVRSASAHIVQDDEAYGKACMWMAWVLEGRHVRQDELVDAVALNLGSAADALMRTADEYEASDGDSSASFDELQNRLWE